MLIKIFFFSFFSGLPPNFFLFIPFLHFLQKIKRNSSSIYSYRWQLECYCVWYWSLADCWCKSDAKRKRPPTKRNNRWIQPAKWQYRMVSPTIYPKLMVTLIWQPHCQFHVYHATRYVSYIYFYRFNVGLRLCYDDGKECNNDNNHDHNMNKWRRWWR